MNRRVATCILAAAFAVAVAAGGPAAKTDRDIGELFTAVLAEHVDAGRVDYAALCGDERLDEVVERMSSVDPGAIENAADRFAFWINAYNAFTLKIVCDNYPIESINDLHFGGLAVGTVLNKTVWDKKFITINGEEMSLNHIEHDILRKEFKDARLHFAVVCASKSCPPLRAEAFVGSRLESQLDDQAKVFLSDPERNSFDMGNKTARLSKIFDWFSKDFGGSDEEILIFVSRFVPANAAAAIRTDLGDWDIEHLDFDWSLNE